MKISSSFFEIGVTDLDVADDDDDIDDDDDDDDNDDDGLGVRKIVRWLTGILTTLSCIMTIEGKQSRQFAFRFAMRSQNYSQQVNRDYALQESMECRGCMHP